MNRSAEPRRGIRRMLRAVAIGTGGLVGLLLALGLAVLLLLRTERTATWTARQVLSRVQVYPGAEIRVGRFRAGPSGWIEARDAQLVEADTVVVASLSGVRLHVDWNALRRGELQIDSLRVDAPGVDLNPLLRGLAAGFDAKPSKSRPASARRGRIQIGSVRVTGGGLRVPLTLRGKPAVLAVRALNIRASQVHWLRAPRCNWIRSMRNSCCPNGTTRSGCRFAVRSGMDARLSTRSTWTRRPRT